MVAAGSLVDRASAGGWVTEGDVDGLGGKTEKGCGKEPGGGLGSTPRDRIPRECGWWPERLLQSGCYRTKSKSGKILVEDRKDSENHPTPAQGDHWGLQWKVLRLTKGWRWAGPASCSEL